MWIKVCGMTSPEAVHTAIAAGVDAVGFVFAPSKRQVTAEQAAHLARAVPARVARIAVMLHPDQSLVDEVLTVFKADVLQADWQDFECLQLPQSLIRLPVLRAGKPLPASLPQRFLFEGAISGTGETTDWSRASQLARQGELILAGGLNPANVCEAVAVVNPFGVDVSSGVESAPGVKDPQKIIEFVAACRSGFDPTLDGVGSKPDLRR
jgi:phosphoribosylanthranilate isomerase